MVLTALLTPVLMMVLMLVLDVLEDRIFRAPPPPSTDEDQAIAEPAPE
ncbi:hypothetical protein PV410_40765 [Streptomyces sp. PA03-5A]|nr:hypothetical protein [Streptomyces sp. PA03-5A]